MTAPSPSGNPARPIPVLAIAGPTCSGKSALASALAKRLGGIVINADSMQIYRELRILTARPTRQEEAAIPHTLYGVRAAAEPGSVAWWAREAWLAIEAAHAAGQFAILCGGTGLYFSALTHGLSPIPDPGPAAREQARSLLADLGAEHLHARLAERDPATAGRLTPTDAQRVARAWEVLVGTGFGLDHWQKLPPPPATDIDLRAVLVDPPRPALRHAIAHRFGIMVDQGALDEVAALLTLDLDPAVPALRAHGVQELAAVLRREIDLQTAIQRAAMATGQYTKRQATWFRHHPLATSQLTLPVRIQADTASMHADRCISHLQLTHHSPP